MKRLTIFVILLGINLMAYSQEPNRKVWANVELNANFLTGKTFDQADSTFNFGPDYNSVQLNLDYWFSKQLLLGATWEVGFNPGVGLDSTSYTSLGAQLVWMFNPRIHLLVNPQYAIIEMNGFESWFNLLLGFRVWINPDLAYVKLAVITLDGRNPFLVAGLAFRVN